MNIQVYEFKIPLGEVWRLNTAGTWVDRDLMISIDVEKLTYRGPYVIKPSAMEAKTFQTKETWVPEDLVVEQITYEEQELNGGKAAYFR